MSRREDIVYKESNTKVIAFLTEKDSEIATKLVKKYQEFEDLNEQAKALAAEARLQSQSARELKDDYKQKLRETINNYFDAAMDSAKTRVIQTQSFILKLGREETEPRKSESIDYEEAFNDIVKLMNIPINVVKEVLDKHTEIELSIPDTKLYKPEILTKENRLNEGFSDVLSKILSPIKSFYNTLISKFKVFDKALEEVEKKYL